MTHELLINGQQVDLGDVNSVLEYATNITGDIGKINLSHSYTVKIPRTARNAKILDNPGQPAHRSSLTRRFLPARLFRNGIDLIGDAQAYILKTSQDAYEIAFVWNTLAALQALSQSGLKLNDLPGLPVLPWISATGAPDYNSSTDGALFAFYNSGLGGYRFPTVNTATHPSMRVLPLLDRILSGAGVPYEISQKAAGKAEGKVILAAPERKPSRIMEVESGSVAQSVTLRAATVNGSPMTLLALEDWAHGWDAPSAAAGRSNTFTTGENDTHRVLLNLSAPASADLEGKAITVVGMTLEEGRPVVAEQEELLRVYFKRNDTGWYLYSDEEIRLSGWTQYAVSLEFSGTMNVTFSRYYPELPLLAANRVHETIDPQNDNRFPIAGNLPDIKQWDFVKACMAMFGWTPVIQRGTLYLQTYDEVLGTSGAYDWSHKVDMTDGGAQEISYALDSWAQRNVLAFKDDAPLGFVPDAEVIVNDATLSESRKLYELPWAASMQGDAQHYKVKEGDTVEVEEVDMEARIFSVSLGEHGQTLNFSEDMYGSGLIRAHYQALQDVVREPVAISAHIRLNEIDLARLDLTRAVYLGQFGRYYAIIRIQTSDTDLCKVELLQLP